MINEFVVHLDDPGVPKDGLQESCPISGNGLLKVLWGSVRKLSILCLAHRCSCRRVSDAMDIPRMGVPAELAERMSMAEQHEYLRARFSRRTMIRGGAVTLGAVAGGVFVPGGIAQAAVPTQATTKTTPATESVNGALVSPFGRHLAFGNDPSTEVTVSWQVPTDVKKPFVRIGAHPWDLSHKIEAEVRPLHPGGRRRER